jgi:hypothetical protein
MKAKNVLLFFIFAIGIASCQPKDSFDWEFGVSAPKHYSMFLHATLYYKGVPIKGASASPAIDPGWRNTTQGVATGSAEEIVPDSVSVNWTSLTDLNKYSASAKLPRQEMLKLLNSDIKNNEGEEVEFSQFIIGVAPGGNATVWMYGSQYYKELIRFKGKKTGEIEAYPEHTSTIWTIGQDYAREDFEYLKFFAIPYEDFEKGEKKFTYNINFEKEDKGEFMGTVNVFSKTGYFNQYHEYVNKLNGLPLPSMLQFVFFDKKEKPFYPNIILPQNFKELYEEPLYNPKTKKAEHYNTIVIVSKKDSDLGEIWLDTGNSRKKIMTFKKFPAKMVKDRDKFIPEPGGYSLPKGFVFPKWNGREPLKEYEVNIWQEE